MARHPSTNVSTAAEEFLRHTEWLEHLDDKKPVEVLLVFGCGCIAAVPFDYESTAPEPVFS
jgi:hypothetical protein